MLMSASDHIRYTHLAIIVADACEITIEKLTICNVKIKSRQREDQ